MNPQKNKGDKAERELAEILTELTGHEVKRTLSAGIPDDVGDLIGIPNLAIQVTSRGKGNIGDAYLQKPREVEQQKKNAGVDHAATFVRHPGVRSENARLDRWRVVLTLEQYLRILQSVTL